MADVKAEKKAAKRAAEAAAAVEEVPKAKKSKKEKTEEVDPKAEKKAAKALAKAAEAEAAAAVEAKAAKKAKKAAKAEEAEPPKSAKKAKKADAEEEDPKAAKKAKKAAKEAAAAAAAADEDDSDDEEEAAAPAVAAPAPAPAAAAAAVDGEIKSIFINNLSWSIDEAGLKSHLGGEITNIKWIEDRDTGKFKGMCIIEFATAADAQAACLKNEEELLGRKCYVRLDEPRAPKSAGREPRKFEMKPKPAGGVKMYCGNLSYDIDDAAMRTFFEDCGHVASIRWVTDRESGEFKGCGFVEFEDTAHADAAILKNGENLMGRAVRLDWAEDKPKREWTEEKPTW